MQLKKHFARADAIARPKTRMYNALLLAIWTFVMVYMLADLLLGFRAHWQIPFVGLLGFFMVLGRLGLIALRLRKHKKRLEVRSEHGRLPVHWRYEK